MPDSALRPRSGSSAKALLLTVLGEFVLPGAGEVWTSTVVRALAVLGVEERNARQALARLADDGLVAARKEGRRARWALTAQGSALLSTGAERIYRFGRDAEQWDGRWCVVLCSVPEEQRAKRHQLRTRLGFAGFGFLSPGVAVSPHLDREVAANRVLDELGLLPAALVLRAEVGSAIADEDVLARAWDLRELARQYEAFVASHTGRAPAAPDQCFRALVELVHDWRRFPFADPEIPPALLPPEWPGPQARALFDSRHAAWSEPARAWYALLESSTLS